VSCPSTESEVLRFLNCCGHHIQRSLPSAHLPLSTRHLEHHCRCPYYPQRGLRGTPSRTTSPTTSNLLRSDVAQLTRYGTAATQISTCTYSFFFLLRPFTARSRSPYQYSLRRCFRPHGLSLELTSLTCIPCSCPEPYHMPRARRCSPWPRATPNCPLTLA
jgi:hypothetical protein